ncbi:putative DCP2 decapping enzyme [Monoraphidium neglectum]|uniref:Putative DCP2 decapping enzyme n=1 Tax=Monoraphidium neglectum TaxID=145388 RepID=A0A0D2JS10_9CHLO|nr:putative DCP2 decapping enzyme [Monoraphidium neglectum]KIZ01783.1 putative DCP2 decapping enzyme [Monoraphidium neglectum]|eukprot:XP_013900802.1 putative DCP2 decapping enzyme [Monoraphidium neglectum]
MFKEFKRNVPVMGAILLDARMEHVLLVRGFKGASCWGFPRGKIMKDESDADCAVREVMEETGYDLEGLLNSDDFIELVLEGKSSRPREGRPRAHSGDRQGQASLPALRRRSRLSAHAAAP